MHFDGDDGDGPICSDAYYVLIYLIHRENLWLKCSFHSILERMDIF